MSLFSLHLVCADIFLMNSFSLTHTHTYIYSYIEICFCFSNVFFFTHKRVEKKIKSTKVRSNMHAHKTTDVVKCFTLLPGVGNGA